MAVRIDIMNRALIRIGAEPLLSESAPNGQTYVEIYDSVIGSLCAEYPWTFQTAFVQLAQRTGPTGNRWSYSYALPSDLAGTPRAVYSSITAGGGSLPAEAFDLAGRTNPVTAFEIYGGVLYSNHTQLWMRYTRTPNPAIWPAYFTELAIKVLMAEYALPAREDQPLREKMLAEIYGPPDRHGEAGLIGKCKSIDSQGRPSSRIAIGANPLVTVRWT